MLRKASKTVPEGNGPVPQKEELESGQLTMGDAFRLLIEKFDRQQERMDSRFDRQQERMDSYFDRIDSRLDRQLERMDSYIDRLDDEMRERDQHLTRLEHGARQPRLAVEADGQASTKTRERTEGAATAVQAMRGDCFFRVEPGPTTNSTSLGMKADSPAPPCRDDSVVECGSAAFKSCLPSMEMRPSTAAGGVSTGDTS